MKTNIATTREQSARLLQCGVPADTADMFYQTPITVSQKATREDILLVKEADKKLFDTDIPAWSLSALLTKVLPSDIDLRMLKLGTGAFNNPNAWSIMYSADLYTEHSDIIEACVLMAEKLTANGYKLNEI